MLEGVTTRKVAELALPRFGLGCAPIGDLQRAASDIDVAGLLADAWAANFRYFDTAPFYGSGLSERRLGDFLRDKPRNEFVLSSKVGRVLVPDQQYGLERWKSHRAMPFRPVYDYSYDGVMRSYETSLQRLGLASIDMLLIHDLGRQTHGEEHQGMLRAAAEGGAKALAELKSAGAIKAFGLGVGEWPAAEEAMRHMDLDCVLLAAGYTLLDQSALDSFLPACSQRKIAVVMGGVFHRGILATGAVPGAMAYGRPAPPELLERVARIEAICGAHGVTLPAAALAFRCRIPPWCRCSRAFRRASNSPTT